MASRGIRVTRQGEVRVVDRGGAAAPGRRCCIDFQVEEHEDSFPMMPPGVSLSETIDQPKIEDAPERETGRR